ncbi:hypothetical protein Dimus_024356, partial [Dionaea muscipula]
MQDDYVHLFVRRPVRRSPIINRGYFARWAVLRKLLFEFLGIDTITRQNNHVKKQVLSLGAGFDTTYFQLKTYLSRDGNMASQRQRMQSHCHPHLHNNPLPLSPLLRGCVFYSSLPFPGGIGSLLGSSFPVLLFHYEVNRNLGFSRRNSLIYSPHQGGNRDSGGDGDSISSVWCLRWPSYETSYLVSVLIVDYIILQYIWVDEGKAPHIYVELDFKEVTSKKASLIETHQQLREKVGSAASISRDDGEVLGDDYKLLPVDLRDLQRLDDVVTLANLDF